MSLALALERMLLTDVRGRPVVDKEDYLLAMERSPIRDIEIKHVLGKALTNNIADRLTYMKGLDVSYHIEGYNAYKAEEL